MHEGDKTTSPADKESGQRRAVPAGAVRRGAELGKELLLLSVMFLAGLWALQIKLAQLSNCLKLSSVKWKYVCIYI